MLKESFSFELKSVTSNGFITGGVFFGDFIDRFPLNGTVAAFVFGVLLIAPVLGATGFPIKLLLCFGGEHPK